MLIFISTEVTVSRMVKLLGYKWFWYIRRHVKNQLLAVMNLLTAALVSKFSVCHLPTIFVAFLRKLKLCLLRLLNHSLTNYMIYVYLNNLVIHHLIICYWVIYQCRHFMGFALHGKLAAVQFSLPDTRALIAKSCSSAIAYQIYNPNAEWAAALHIGLSVTKMVYYLCHGIFISKMVNWLMAT